MARIPAAKLDAWRALLGAHAAIVGNVESALADSGLPPLAWYDVLWAIRRAPERRVRMAELAESLTVTRGGATKLVDRLEGAGLLVRRKADDDGRGLYAEVTPAGEEVLRAMWPVYSGVLKRAFADVLADEEARAIAAGLNRASAAARPTTTS